MSNNSSENNPNNEFVENEPPGYRTNMRINQELMSPHFFFNTLNGLVSLIELKEKKDALKYIYAFAAVARFHLRTELYEIIPVHEEVKNLENYLHLLDIRFPNQIKIDIDPVLRESKMPVSMLVMELWLESALRHSRAEQINPFVASMTKADRGVWIKHPIQWKLDPAKYYQRLEELSLDSAGRQMGYLQWEEKDGEFTIFIPGYRSEEYIEVEGKR